MYERSSATYLWAAMTHLTPSALDILVNPGGGIRDLNTKIARNAMFLNGKIQYIFSIYIERHLKKVLQLLSILKGPKH
jgi:hypothetical protein